MSAFSYRELQLHQVDLLESIDRSEQVDGVYRWTGSTLRLEASYQAVEPWQGAELSAYVARLRALMVAGGRAFGAWDYCGLVGVGSLDTRCLRGKERLMKLDMLYVSSGCRGRGIGRALTERITQLARSLGAHGLYISATPSRGTVDAYLRLGACLRSPDRDGHVSA